MKLKIKLYGNAFLPKKAKQGDACYDVVARKIEIGFAKATIYLGFETEIPEGWKGVLVPRSSFTKEKWTMLNSPGQIDSGYRNEWQMRLDYIGDKDFMSFPFKEGDRVGQIYFERVNDVEFELCDELSDSERGKGGFGHTGK